VGPRNCIRCLLVLDVYRSVARILVGGGLKIREWGQMRPERPKAGGWVLGEAVASPLPIS